MNPHIIFLLTADQVIFEQNTSKPSIIGIFQDIIAGPELPAIASFSVYGRLGGLTTGTINLVINIIDSTNNLISTLTIPDVPIVDGQNELQIRGVFNNISFPSIGRYRINVFIDGVLLTPRDEHSISVRSV